MDPPLPDDFDPYGLGETPVKQPSQRNDKDEQCQGAPDDEEDKPGYLAELLPMPFSRLAKVVSCCTGVGVLYLISAWDHGFIPGVNSPHAASSELLEVDSKYTKLQEDVSELYTLSIARAIRDAEADICIAPSLSKRDLLESLQYKYELRTRKRYPSSACPSVR